MAHYCSNEELKTGIHRCFIYNRLFIIVIFLKKPCWCLLMPHQSMCTHTDVMLFGNCKYTINRFQCKFRNCGFLVIVTNHISFCLGICNRNCSLFIQHVIRLHFIFQCKTIEMFVDKFHGTCILHFLTLIPCLVISQTCSDIVNHTFKNFFHCRCRILWFGSCGCRRFSCRHFRCLWRIGR